MKRKILTLLLALAMVLTMLPMTALATSADDCAGDADCQHQAAIGTTHYDTLVEAYANLPRNVKADAEPTVITLLRDCAGGGIGSDSDKGMNYVVDFNGHTYTVGAPAVGSVGTVSQGLRVMQSSKAVFKNGTLKADNYSLLAQVVHTYGDVTLQDFTIDCTADSYAQIAVEADCGTLNILGNSSILARNAKSIGLYAAFWHYGNYNGTTVNVDTTGKITGILKYEFDEDYTGSAAATENKGILNIQKGNFEIGQIVASFSGVTNPDLKVAKINISGGTFDCIDALKYLTNGANVTVKLSSDVSTNGRITIPSGADVVLDLNGKTFTGTTRGLLDGVGSLLDVNAATLTVQDSSAGQSGKLVADEYGISAANNGKIIVNSGTIESNYAALSGNNTNGDMNFEVNGGTLTSKLSEAIYMPGQVNLLVTGGEINGGVSTRMGQITVTGGTINGMASGCDSISDYYDYSGSAWIGDAIYVLAGTYNSENTEYGNTANITISGGTINGSSQHGIAVYEIGTGEAQNVNVTINGGMFSGAKGAVAVVSDGFEHSSTCNASRHQTANPEGVNTTVTIYAGYFTSEPDAAYLAPGKAVYLSNLAGYDYMVATKEAATPVTPSEPAQNPFNENAGKNSVKFSDVAGNAWYASAVNYAVDKGLMNGTGDSKFSPEADTTRGMIVTILARLDGKNTSGTPWYQAGQRWAMEYEISDGTNMTGAITREQLVAMLFRYAVKNGLEAVTLSENLTQFTDASDISAWAVSAMQWAVAQGLIQGSNGQLRPQANASRAEVATILMRFCELLNK